MRVYVTGGNLTSRRQALLITALIIAAGVLSGCRLDADVDLQVEPSGAGVLTLGLSADPDLQERAEAAGVDPLGDVVGAATDAGWIVNASGGERRTVRMSRAFAGPEELAVLSTDLSRALAGPELAPLSPLKLRLTERTVELDGEVGMRLAPAVADLAMTKDEAVEVLRESVRLRFTAKLPGEILEANNNGQRGDGTLVWTAAAGELRPIRVVATRPRPLLAVILASLTPPVAIATLAGSLSVLALWWFRSRTEDPLWPTRAV